MRLNLVDRHVIALKHHNFTEIKPTSAYRVFFGQHPAGCPVYVYLGKAGAVRVNRHGRISKGSTSIDHNHSFYKRFLTFNPFEE